MDALYIGEKCVPSSQVGPSRPYTPTLEERLLERKHHYEASLKEINEALAALQANPELLKIVNLVTKINY